MLCRELVEHIIYLTSFYTHQSIFVPMLSVIKDMKREYRLVYEDSLDDFVLEITYHINEFNEESGIERYTSRVMRSFIMEQWTFGIKDYYVYTNREGKRVRVMNFVTPY